MKTVGFGIKWRWFSSLAAAAAVVALAVVTTTSPTTPVLVRYVGPALPDGSRVTFLHPAAAKVLLTFPINKQLSPWVIQYLQTVKQVNIADKLLSEMPAWCRRDSPANCSINVMVSTAGKLRSPTENVKNGRIEQHFVINASPSQDRFYGDNIDIRDAQSALEYQFQYVFLGTSTSPVFAKQEAVIINSFQVLPPGAVPPVP